MFSVPQTCLGLVVFVGALVASAASNDAVSTWDFEISERYDWEVSKRYEPNWASLDKRPLPSWYDEAKIGIFLHWGVFSVPSYEGAWLWYWWKGPQPRLSIVEFMARNYKPDFTYGDFAPQFTAEFYQPARWADIFKASGAKYVVLTTKHHEGFCNWPTKYSWNWNSMDVGPKRDLVGDLVTALRDKGLKFGAYHSLFEFFHPLYLQDKKNNFTTQDFVRTKTLPELYELVNTYKPEVIWSDGDWEAPDTYWNSTEFLAWLYNDSPVKDVVVTNDRWGAGCTCHHGGYLTCQDKYNPKKKQNRKFEDSTTMDKYAWTHRRNMRLSDVHSMEQVVATIAEIVSCGGNLLINVGPTKDGVIIPIFEERLRQMGEWLGVNGEGIYKTRPWTFVNDSLTEDVWFTSKSSASRDTTVYAILLTWPTTSVLSLGRPSPTADTKVTLLGYSGEFKWAHHTGSGIDIALPKIPFNKLPCKWGWVFKLTMISN